MFEKNTIQRHLEFVETMGFLLGGNTRATQEGDWALVTGPRAWQLIGHDASCWYFKLYQE